MRFSGFYQESEASDIYTRKVGNKASCTHKQYTGGRVEGSSQESHQSLKLSTGISGVHSIPRAISGVGIFGNEILLPDKNTYLTTAEGKEAKGGNFRPSKSPSSDHNTSSVTPTEQIKLRLTSSSPTPLFAG